jgi:EAL domain-containing protein (putative c-di-GMP-specific phosphodiesterase class I)
MPPSSASQSSPREAVHRLLVVDDEPMVRELVARILQRAGYRVVEAEGGPEALAAAAREPFDLAIVDYGMPHINGVHVLRELRVLQPRCQRILCSGNLNLPLVIEAVNRGAISQVLAKPIHPEELLRMVAESLGARQRDDELRRSEGLATLAEQRRNLEECLDGDFINLALQPISNADGSVGAFEGLLRSSHPGLDSAATVLRAAEELSQLSRLAELIARRAVARLELLAGDWLLFINAHPKELTDPELLRRRLEILWDWKDRLVVEITERTYVLGLARWAASVKLLTEAGFALAVDDLGSGYNSLTVLAELQPQYLKVDMSMTRGVDGDPRKQRLIEMLVRFAESTDAKLIAEGIETEAEAQALRDCAVHLFQGYFIGRPSLDISLAERLLDAGTTDLNGLARPSPARSIPDS